MKIFMNNRILLKISPSSNSCKPLQSLVTSIKQDNLVVQIMIWKGIANMKYAVTGATGKFGQTVIKVLAENVDNRTILNAPVYGLLNTLLFDRLVGFSVNLIGTAVVFNQISIDAFDHWLLL